MRTALPIDQYLPEILDSLSQHQSLIIKAHPGTGKTTRVPQALLKDISGKILVLEPRRLAARLSAEFIASELGEDIGITCGYQIRYEGIFSEVTRILFVTEGVFTRTLLDNPNLAGIGAVILDEFHERHLHTDLALAMLVRLMESSRPDLKLIIMSATIDTTSLECFLPKSKTLVLEGKTYPVEIEYLVQPNEDQLSTSSPRWQSRILDAIKKMIEDERCKRNILVFLPGAREIYSLERLINQSLSPREHVVVLPLFADLSKDLQKRVFDESGPRKIILSTNVAETSLTLPSITGVIDSGVAKIAGYASWSGLPTLDIRKISKASAIQRSGRAGRTEPGVAYRVYSLADFQMRHDFTPAEILRLDLVELYLQTKMFLAHTKDADSAPECALRWFEKPEKKLLESAHELLVNLGAINRNDTLTDVGKNLARLPIHPRLGAMILCGQSLGMADYASFAAALLSERVSPDKSHSEHMGDFCDLIYLMEQFVYDDSVTKKRVEKLFRLFANKLGFKPSQLERLVPQAHQYPEFSTIILAGFPDRVAKQRKEFNQKHYNLCLGRTAVLSDRSIVKNAEWIIALDAIEASPSKSSDRTPMITLASAIDPSLFELAPGNFFRQTKEFIWNDQTEKVEVFSATFYGDLAVRKDRLDPLQDDLEAISLVLARKLKETWPKPFCDDAELVTYHGRRNLIVKSGHDLNLPEFIEELGELFLVEICHGKRSFEEISKRSLLSYIEEQISYSSLQRLNELTPLFFTNRSGKKLKINYEVDGLCWIEGFIQDFFGIIEHPSLFCGEVPIKLHLLAPNRRPVQVTSNLKGFWESTYPEVMRELSRRYPRHFWPDDPHKASPVLHKPRKISS